MSEPLQARRSKPGPKPAKAFEERTPKEQNRILKRQESNKKAARKARYRKAAELRFKEEQVELLKCEIELLKKHLNQWTRLNQRCDEILFKLSTLMHRPTLSSAVPTSSYPIPTPPQPQALYHRFDNQVNSSFSVPSNSWPQPWQVVHSASNSCVNVGQGSSDFHGCGYNVAWGSENRPG